MSKYYRIVNTWNGGTGGRKIVFTSDGIGVSGYNECFKWILDNTPFSVSEATTNQGYNIEEVD